MLDIFESVTEVYIVLELAAGEYIDSQVRTFGKFC